MINSIYMTGIAFLLLIPFIYFLPLGFTKTGKIILIGLSLLIAIVGIGAMTTFPLWQTIAILVVLAFLFTYLLTKRLGTVLFAEKLDVEIEHVQFSRNELLSNLNIQPKLNSATPEPPINKLEMNHLREDELENNILDINVEEIVENRQNNQMDIEPEIEKDQTIKSDGFNKSKASIIENDNKYEEDDGQLEDFFENRLNMIKNSTENMKENIEEKDILFEDDYIIPEIKFDPKNK